MAIVEAAAAIADASNEVNSLIDPAIHKTGCIYLRGLPVKTASSFSKFMLTTIAHIHIHKMVECKIHFLAALEIDNLRDDVTAWAA